MNECVRMSMKYEFQKILCFFGPEYFLQSVAETRNYVQSKRLAFLVFIAAFETRYHIESLNLKGFNLNQKRKKTNDFELSVLKSMTFIYSF